MNKGAVPIIAQGLYSYQIGGGERVGADLALEFQARGYSVVCFAFYDNDGPIRAELEQAGILCLDLNYLRRRRLLRRLTYQIEFFRFLRRFGVQALLVHHATALLICGVAARAAGVRRIVMIEHAIHQLRERPSYRHSAMRRLRHADIITGVDPGIVDYFRDVMRYPPDRLRYIPNGVRVLDRQKTDRLGIRASLGISADSFVFLFAGRLQPEKDVGTLLAATAAIDPTLRARVRLLIAGDGPERSSLEQRVAALGLGSIVTFLGFRRDVPDLMGGADCFVMTSVTEGQPMALVEAMAVGLPCIATAVGGIPRMLGDGAGLLVPASDPVRTAAAMASVVSNPAVGVRCVAVASDRVAAQHDMSVVVDAYLDCLGLAPRFE